MIIVANSWLFILLYQWCTVTQISKNNKACRHKQLTKYLTANYVSVNYVGIWRDNRFFWNNEIQRKYGSQIVEEWKVNLMSLAILFHLLCGRLVFSSLCVGVFAAADIWWCSLCRLKHYHTNRTVVLQPAKRKPPNIRRSKNSNTQRTENKTTDVVIHQHSRRLLKMYILMSETCWAHKNWNKTAGDIKFVFHSTNKIHFLLAPFPFLKGEKNGLTIAPCCACVRACAEFPAEPTSIVRNLRINIIPMKPT